MSDKTPQPSEWWEKENVRVQVVGSKRNGVIVGEHECGSICMFVSYHDWQHLPDCTGFDWQPETFPQWYVKDDRKPFADCDHIVRTSKTEMCGINACDGTETGTAKWGEYQADLVAAGQWIQITKEEAESRIEKPQPVESPDDWVVQDRVPRRIGIDQFRWIFSSGESEWRDERYYEHAVYTHGEVDSSGHRFELRCRRKDLPPLPNKFATLANEIEQLRADMMRRCDELGVRLTELEEGGNG